MTAQEGTDDQVNVIEWTAENLQFCIPPDRNWIVPKPSNASLMDLLRDRGNDVARDFFILNPHLPTSAFTVQNVLEYILRAMFARNLKWKNFPCRWTITIGLDDIPTESQDLLLTLDSKMTLFSRILKFGGETDTYKLMAIATPVLPPVNCGPNRSSPDKTTCAIIEILRQRVTYIRSIPIERRQLTAAEVQPSFIIKSPQENLQPAESFEATAPLEKAGENVTGQEAGTLPTDPEWAKDLGQHASASPAFHRTVLLAPTKNGVEALAMVHKRRHGFPISKAKR
ncbi:MAG: hypothetical protein Q9209_005838 [Squamulea sp. 1 TL-2023]